VSPREAASAFSRPASSNPTLTEGTSMCKSARPCLPTDCWEVMCTAWHDREGTDYAASHPPSVAFDLYLIRVETAWCCGRPGTTRPRSRSARTFLTYRPFSSKGRWMTAARAGGDRARRDGRTLFRGRKGERMIVILLWTSKGGQCVRLQAGQNVGGDGLSMTRFRPPDLVFQRSGEDSSS